MHIKTKHPLKKEGVIKNKNKRQTETSIYITNNPVQVIKSKFLQKHNAKTLVLTDSKTKFIDANSTK